MTVRVGVSGMDAGAMPALDPALVIELWEKSGAADWGLEREAFEGILEEAGQAANFGLADGGVAHGREQAAFFHGLHVADLVLARACAAGHEGAWQHFVREFRQPLTRAAIAIAGNASAGRDLADQIYAELYGLKSREGERRSPLTSYRGRGSLMGWLRTIIAQRHVDRHRSSRHEESLDERDAVAAEPEEAIGQGERLILESALRDALRARDSEERFLLAAYYLDGQTLSQMARTLGVHEATVSRKLRRAAESTRKHILHGLQKKGMSRRAAEETLETDPRDVQVNLKKLLQYGQGGPFKEQMTE